VTVRPDDDRRGRGRPVERPRLLPVGTTVLPERLGTAVDAPMRPPTSAS